MIVVVAQVGQDILIDSNCFLWYNHPMSKSKKPTFQIKNGDKVILTLTAKDKFEAMRTFRTDMRNTWNSYNPLNLTVVEV